MPPESSSPRPDSATAAALRVGHVGRPHERWVAPGGWRRALLGTAAGLVAGVLLAAAGRDEHRRCDDQVGRP